MSSKKARQPKKKTQSKNSAGSSAQGQLIPWAQVFFFLSGATALLYQVLWTRRLTLVFGHSVLAVSTVVTAFMAGLALGSFTFGRWTDRERFQSAPSQLLLLYAALEAFIGLWALLSLPLLYLAEQIYFALPHQSASPLALHLACFGLASLVLIPPTTAMGATMPVLTKLLVRQSTEVGPILSRLYGINTLGALTGALAGGFFLLPVIGLRASMVLGGLLNLGIGYVARRIALAQTTDLKPPDQELNVEDLSPFPEEKRARASWLVPVTFALGGAASMAFQVAWTRGLCLSIGSSVYAFSTILVTFLGGLGAGSFLYGKLAGRTTAPKLQHLCWLYVGIALAGLVSIPALEGLPYLFWWAFPWAQRNFVYLLCVNLGLSGLVLFLPTLLMGIGFPLATALYSTSLGRLGRSVGQVYGMNTLGCIVGAFASGFLIMPNWGAQWTLKLACMIYLSAGAILAVNLKRNRPKFFTVLTILMSTLAVWALPPWNTGVMAGGVAIYSDTFDRNVAAGTIFQKPAFYQDGLSSTVSFHYGGSSELAEIPHMKVNGKVDASMGDGDRLTQYMLGYLPTLCHPKPKRVAIIGLGGGFTVEAVAQCPGVENIDVVELEPAVVGMAKYWEPFNGAVLKDPRVNLLVNDGRSFVLTSPTGLDVLISEPSNPWIAGIGNLFTADFYRSAQAKLNNDGIMCQWFNLYSVSLDDVKMVVRTFYEVFPHGQLWQSSGGDLILLGAAQPIEFSLPRVQAAFDASATTQRHFFESRLYLPDYVPGHFVMTRERALAFAGPGVLNSDDRPLLEFSAPFSLYKSTADSNARALCQAQREVFPSGFKETESSRRQSLYGAENRNHNERVKGLIKEYGMVHPDIHINAVRHRLRTEQAPPDAIRRMFQSSHKSFGPHPLTDVWWADFEVHQSDFPAAVGHYLSALADPPAGSQAYIQQQLGICLLELGDPQRALEPLLNAATFSESYPVPHALIGTALIALQRDAEAEKILLEAEKRAPYYPYTKLQLAYALFNQGKAELAEHRLLEFLAIEPENEVGWYKLGVCRRALGNLVGSRSALQQALELSPNYIAAQEALNQLENSDSLEMNPTPK